MAFQDRFKTAACEYVMLSTAGRDNIQDYAGAGYALVRVEEDDVVQIAYLNMIQEGAMQDQINAMLTNGDEWWWGMMSCYELCEPRRVSLSDPTGIAKLVRLHQEEWS